MAKEKTKSQLQSEYLLKKVAITPDNISLYYEFMSKKDLEDNLDILTPIFDHRVPAVSDIVCKGIEIKDNYDEVFHCTSSEFTVFGVKDTLKPVYEYVKEIKDTKEYKICAFERYYQKYGETADVFVSLVSEQDLMANQGSHNGIDFRYRAYQDYVAVEFI